MKIWEETQKNSKNTINFLIRNLYAFKSKRILFFKLITIFIFIGLIFVPLDLGIQKKYKFSRFGPSISSGIYLALGGLNKTIGKLTRETFEYGDSLISIGYRYLKSSFIKTEELRIDINMKNYNVLKVTRDKAMKRGILVRSENDEVNGELSYKGKTIPIKLRLKGDWTDHLIGEKWSFRLKTRKGNSFLGMNEFSLQHPRTRNYINEFVFHKLLKYEKLPYLRYQFLPVYLNGKNLGIYALEEHFTKAVIENSGFREGPIIKISDHFRNEEKRMREIDLLGNFYHRSSNNAKLETFNPNRMIKSDSNVSQFLLADKLMEEFLKGRLKTKDVFDIKNTAKYFALNDLLQSGASNTWYDMRFYFDPISSRLSPIGYDANPPIRSFGRYLSLDRNALNLFDDIEFLKEYVKNLELVSSDKFLNDFLLNISNELNLSVQILNKTFPHVRFLKNEFVKNQKYIKKRLSPLRAMIINNDNFITDSDQISLKISNATTFPLEILGFSLFEGDYKIKDNKILNPREKLKRFNFQELKFIKIKEGRRNISILENEILVNYRIYGSNEKLSEKIKLLPKSTYSSISSELVKRTPNYENFNSLIINNLEKEILIEEDITINKPLILPINTKLSILPGVKINLRENGLILVQGSLEILGEEDKPVNINGSESGNGILVINADKTSFIKNAIFDGLNSPKEISLNLTGGVTFYKSKVEITNSKFFNSNSEDALNLVKSNFMIINSEFKNNVSDALDVDFSDGIITNSSFNIIGNDGIDISGSKVNINKIKLNKTGDKAISVGERSNLLGNDIDISNSYIGIASKDLSKVKINNLNSKNVSFCFAAYQKKSEYGPGFIELKGSNKNCATKFLLENGSSISSSEFNFIPNANNVYQKLYK